MNESLNSKHSFEHYKVGLKNICIRLRNLSNVDGGAIGNQTFIRSIKECRWLRDLGHVTFDKLKLYIDTVDTSCFKKYSPPLEKLTVEMVRIWLNKVDMLCIAAGQNPQQFTFLIDVAMPEKPYFNELVKRINMVVTSPNTTHGLSMMVSPWTKNPPLPFYFYHKGCTRYHYFSAAFMGIYGQNCEPLLTAYQKSVHHLISTRSHCPCFDEENAMSLTYFNNPHLFNTGVEVPQKIISPGLPKTGTTTLADSLHLLGLNLQHGVGNSFVNNWCDGVTNGLEHEYESLHRLFPTAKWIVTYSKNITLWAISLKKHLAYFTPITGCKGNKKIFSEPSIINALAAKGLTMPTNLKGLTTFTNFCNFSDGKFYKAFYNEYYRRLFTWLNTTGVRYLIFDVRNNISWNDLAEVVLRCPNNNTAFPHSNKYYDKLSRNYCSSELRRKKKTAWYPCKNYKLD